MRVLFLMLIMLMIMAMAGCFPLIDMDGKYDPDTGSDGESPCQDGQPVGTIDPFADNDWDGYTSSGGDCNDCDPFAYPGANEFCDGVDNDCDGMTDEDAVDQTTWFADADEDGAGVDAYTILSCDQPSGYASVAGDCDDGNPEVRPDADELCDEIDNDCDGMTDESDALDTQDWFADADEDGFGDENASTRSCNEPSGYVANKTDCDDTNAELNPNANEVCDEIDNDCDEMVDDADKDVDPATYSTWYLDADSDGYGDSAVLMAACSAPSGYVANQTDCDDANASVNPGVAEVCGDKIDNDCYPGNDLTGSTWYDDLDKDGYGDPAKATVSCPQPTDTVLDNTDCDDTDASINPGASEYCDSADNDCDGTTDESDAVDASTWYRDSDSDGYGDVSTSLVSCSGPSGYVSDTTDCDDTDSLVNPGADEYCVTSYDDDCNGSVNESSAIDASIWYRDSDSDGYGDATTSTVGCTAPAGYVDNDYDCDDTDASVWGSAEVCDGLDNDCDGSVDEGVTTTYYRDADSDGYGTSGSTTSSCSAPTGYVADNTDCDDTRSGVYPGASEYCSTSYDDDCDGSVNESSAVDASTWYKDSDSDTFGDASSSTVSCTTPTGYVADNTDCDDTRSGVYPGASEYCSTSYDDDCDGSVNESGAVGEVTFYLDADSDGYGVSTTTTKACSVPSGYASSSGDCDDADADVYPGASEYCSTSYDDDCDGSINESSAVDASTWYKDSDSDTFGDASSLTGSCTVPTGYVANDSDCDDTDATVNPDGVEYDFVIDLASSDYLVEVDNCSDGSDNNCDGDRDSSDWACSDDDVDGIYNGADPYIGGYDIDTDGIEEVCGLSENLFEPDWTMDDVYVQVGGTWTMLTTTVTLTSITVSGISIDAWCYEPTSSGTGYAGYVSTVGMDGSSAVDTSDCSDWVRPVEDVCDVYGDHYCEPFTSSDGCSSVGNRAFDWSLSTSGVISPH